MEATVQTTRDGAIGDTIAASLRRAAIAAVASGIAGVLIGGLGSRLAMRIAALAAPEARGLLTENGNVIGEITLAGTIALLVVGGLASAIVGAGASVVFDPWLPRRTVARGLVLGGFLLAFGGTLVIDPANPDFVLLGNRTLNVMSFSSLLPAFGLIASGTAALLDRWIPPAASFSPRWWALTMAVGLPVVPGTIGVALVVAPTFGLTLVGARGAVAAARAFERRGRRLRARVLFVVATGAVALVLALTGADYVRSVGTIL
jgi:hypothetical protein